MKKQILLIIMTLFTMSGMAVNLPSNSYRTYGLNTEPAQPYTLSIGTKFVNTSTVGAAYGGGCKDLGKNNDNFQDICTECCASSICDAESPSEVTRCESETDDAIWSNCMTDCSGVHLNQPLDAPVFFLLALIAAYGAVVVYRRKMQEV